MVNKKGKTNMVTVLSVVLIIFVGLVAWRMFIPSKPTAQVIGGGTVDVNTGGSVIQTINTGGASSIKLSAVDKASVSSSTQYGVTGYCWKSDSPSILVTGDAGTGLSATATTSVNAVSVGDKVKCTAFNNTLYGDFYPVDIDLKTEGGVAYKIPVYLSGGAKLTTFDRNDKSLSEFSTNFSLPANGEYTFSRLKIEQNNTNRVFMLWGLGVNTIRDTNISDLKMDTIGLTSSGVAGRGSVSVERSVGGLTRDTNLRFIFRFKQDDKDGIMLKNNDYVTTGSLTITGNGNGCGGYSAQDAGELVTLTLIDANQFVSVAPATQGMIKIGAETDSSVGTDVGQGDLRYQYRCKGSLLGSE